VPPPASYLTRAWKLAPEDGAPRRLADFVAYRPDYIILRWTDRPNFTPRSPSTGPSSLADRDRVEAKIQGSLKTELISRQAFERARLSAALGHFGIDNARLWFAYTQQMNWQAFNRGESRPISDTDYEPELILTLGTRNAGDGLKLVNLGITHQSNGLDPSEHRGWSRVYVQGGWEWGRFALLPRLWHVVPQSDDDNPNIRRFMGSGDVVARYQMVGGSVASLLLRQNLDSGRGFRQLDWATPVMRRLGGLKFHVQITSGYGESLIDYNHHQTTIGAGVSFGDW
jgi:phospholipase A1